jgi:transcriptional regulator with XRE-family HTH domain
MSPEPTEARATIVGRAIRRERKSAGLSQDALAERVGVSRVTVSRWENGRATPTLECLFTLIDILGVSGTDLLVDVPTRPRLTGWPQVVDFQGTAMRIVQAEFGAIDQTLCMSCGTHEHRKTITLRLVDEAHFQESSTR